MCKRDYEDGELTGFDSDFGWSGPVGRMSTNIDLAVAEQRDGEARMADESPDAPQIMRAACELLADQFQLLKQTLVEQLAARGISCPVTVGWVMKDSDVTGETNSGRFAVTCYLTPNVTAGGSGETVTEAALDVVQNVDCMMGDAAPFRLVPQKPGNDPRAA